MALQTHPHLTTSACKSLFLLHEANPAEGRGVEDGYNLDGISANITATLADRYGNLVPDGTAVSFRNEGGLSSINPSCTTTGGKCSVVFSGSGTRPTDGRLTVLATAVGEESFTDANGNGIFDAAETFVDLPEAFIDGDEDGTRDTAPAEEFVDFNNDGLYNLADSSFNGILRSSPSIASTTLSVRSSVVQVLSGSDAFFNLDLSTLNPTNPPIAAAELNPIALDCSAGGAVSRLIRVTDARGQVMPAGTTVAFASSAGTITSIPTTFVVPNTNNKLIQIYPVSIRSSALPLCATAPTNGSGTLTVTVRTPGGVTTILGVGVTDSL